MCVRLCFEMMFRAGVMCLTLGVVLLYYILYYYILLIYYILYIVYYILLYIIIYYTYIIYYIIYYTYIILYYIISYTILFYILFLSSSQFPIHSSSPFFCSLPIFSSSNIPLPFTSSSSQSLLFLSQYSSHSKYTCRHLDPLTYITDSSNNPPKV